MKTKKYMRNCMSASCLMAMVLATTLLLAGCGSGAANSPGDEAESVSASVTEATTEGQAPESASQEETINNNGSTDAVEESIAASEQTEEAETTASGKDALVIYFSRTGEQYTVGEIDKGNTAIVAEMIAEEADADLYEVVPEEDKYPYTYDELIEVAKQEQNEGARPLYRADVPDLSQYNTIFIGSPVWWGDWPMIMYTFFENEDLSGKTLIPFSTHEGSGLAGFDQKLSSAIPDATVLSGLAIRGNDAQNDQNGVRTSVKEWLDGLP